MNESIALAKEILRVKKTTRTSYIPVESSDTSFVQYKDNYIEIIAATNTQAMHIELFSPLTLTDNPIIYVDDEGLCYRNHGERGYFIMYAERLLGKQLSLGCLEQNKKYQRYIDELVSETLSRQN